MNNIFKRTLSLLLVLVMCISFVPATALAVDTEELAETEETVEATEPAETVETTELPPEEQTEESLTQETAFEEVLDKQTQKLNEENLKEEIESEIVIEIKEQPVDAFVNDGTASFYVAALTSTTDELCYIWQRFNTLIAYTNDEERESGWENMTGETSSQLLITGLDDDTALSEILQYRFRCVVFIGEVYVLSQEVTVLPHEDVVKTVDSPKYEDEDVHVSYLFNSIYEDQIDCTAVADDLMEFIYSPKFEAMNGDSQSETEEDAVCGLRNALKSRNSTYIVTVKNPYSESALVIGKNIAFDAVAHTGVPTEGDYICWQGMRIAWYQSEDNDEVTFTFNMNYYTTLEQESEVDAEVHSILSLLNVSDKTDYEKVHAVYEYVTSNIYYDKDYIDEVESHTAYNGLIKHRCVCQGYALVMYRLLLELGIDCRVVVGIGNGGGHAWNLVGISGSYYYTDATWDIGTKKYEDFQFSGDNTEVFKWFVDGTDHFLKGHFPRHYTIDALAETPAGTYPTDEDMFLWAPDMSSYSISLSPYQFGPYLTQSVSEFSLTSGSSKIVTLTLSESISDEAQIYPLYDADEISVIMGSTSENSVPVKVKADKGTTGPAEICFYVRGADGKQLGQPVYLDVSLSGTSTYTVYFSANGGSGAPSSISGVVSGSTAKAVCIPTTVPTRDGYSFLYWYNGSNVYYPGQYYAFGSISTTLYAYWKQETYTVTLRTNGGSCSTSSMIVSYGKPYGAIPIPSKEGYKFLGWSLYMNKFNSVTSDTIVERTYDHSLYATWIETKVEYSLSADGTLTISGDGSLSLDLLPQWESTNNIKSVVILDGVTSIPADAFKDYTEINSAVIPNSVESIGSSAFSGCTSLCSLTIPFSGGSPTNNTYLGYIFGASSYSNNSSCIPESLKTVTITGGTSIGAYAFYSCSGLTEISIPESITSIGRSAFIGCSSLSSITLPFVGGSSNRNTYLGYIFGADSYNNNSTYVPKSLKTVTITRGTSINSYAFYGCSNLTEISIPNDVTSIGDYAFKGCSSLTEFSIPSSVTSIGRQTFFNCKSLAYINIPKNVTMIGGAAFGGCSGLKAIMVETENTQYHSTGNCLIETSNKKLIAGCNNSVAPTDGSITCIDSYSFYDCSDLREFNIPSCVTSIGSYAFYNCSGLTEIDIPNDILIKEFPKTSTIQIPAMAGNN